VTDFSRFANNSQKDYRVSNQPNALALTALPFIARVARSLPPDSRQDAEQTGFITALQLAQVWQPGGYPFLSAANQKSIRRDMLREVAHMAPEGLKLFRAGMDAIMLDDKDPKESEDDTEDREDALHDDNIDLENDQLHNELIAAIETLPEDGRTCMAHVLAGYTVSEFAREYDLTQSSADRLYQRSLEALRERMRG
jgi:RNA polymerase sigma factor (sigma-70 family)